MELSALKERAKSEYKIILQRKRELYKLARSYGFSPIESKILSGTSKTNIDRLAKEINYQSE